MATPWDHQTGSLGGITGNLEGGDAMGSPGGIIGRDHWRGIIGSLEDGYAMGALGGISGRDLWVGSLVTWMVVMPWDH